MRCYLLLMFAVEAPIRGNSFVHFRDRSFIVIVCVVVVDLGVSEPLNNTWVPGKNKKINCYPAITLAFHSLPHRDLNSL